jgi:hypothetical protein
LPYYRAFLIDTTGHVFAVRVLNSLEDGSALRLAAKIQTPCCLVEIWNRTIKVGAVEPKNKMVQRPH